MPTPTVFIGSSSEQLILARAVELWLDEAGCKPVLWTTVFEPGDYTLERLLTQAHGCDGAVMIFGEDDKTWFRKNDLMSPRDNVVYELGLFMGAAKSDPIRRIIFCRVGGSKVASDLAGISFVPIDPHNPTRPKTREEIVRYAERLKEFARIQKSQLFQITSKRELFDAGSRLISRPTGHVTLAAKTPVPLMGPRPYNKMTTPFDYEVEQYRLYWNVADKASKGGLDFNLIASVPSVAEDLRANNNKAFYSHFEENLKRLYAFIEAPGSKAKLYWHDGLCPPAFLVTDNTALLWWKGGNGDSIWMQHSSNDLASALATSSTAGYTTLSFDEISSRLGAEASSYAAR